MRRQRASLHEHVYITKRIGLMHSDVQRIRIAGHTDLIVVPRERAQIILDQLAACHFAHRWGLISTELPAQSNARITAVRTDGAIATCPVVIALTDIVETRSIAVAVRGTCYITLVRYEPDGRSQTNGGRWLQEKDSCWKLPCTATVPASA